MGMKSLVSESLLSHPKLWFFAKNALRSMNGRRDMEETLLPFLVRANGIALDVGANRGIYTRIMLARNRHVVSIEPNPDCARILERVFKNQVRVIAGAASNTDGEAISAFQLAPTAWGQLIQGIISRASSKRSP